MKVFVFLLFSILILQISSIGIFCDNSASHIGGGGVVLDFDSDVLEYELLGMDHHSFNLANTCASKKICTFSCSCGKAYYFDIGTKKITFPPSVKLIHTLENDVLEDSEEISPDDATTEIFKLPKIKTPKVTIKPPRVDDAFPKLSAKYDEFCIQKRSKEVISKIDSIINSAVSRNPQVLNALYQHTPLILKTHLTKVLPSILKNIKTVQLKAGGTKLQGFGKQYNGRSPQKIGLFMSTQQKQTITLGKILKDFAETVNRLCEEDELISSTPIEYLMELWNKYVEESSPNVPKTTHIKNLVSLILKEIVEIWVKRCECSDLIKSADPYGNYQSQKTTAEQACKSMCAKKPYRAEKIVAQPLKVASKIVVKPLKTVSRGVKSLKRMK